MTADHQGSELDDTSFFAVLGPHRSGTSCVAMVMHHLGVHMGNRLVGYESAGGGEALELVRLCERAMPFPSTSPIIDDSQLIQQLASWVANQKREAKSLHSVAGGKYPHLCRFADHLYASQSDSMRIVSVDRDIEASIRSLQARSNDHQGQWFSASPDQCEQVQRVLLDHRETFIANHPEIPLHRIDFVKLTQEPRSTVLSLIDFLEISPTKEQIDSAVNHIMPELRRHG